MQLLLGYLGTNKSEWEQTLSKKRNLYKNFVVELILCDPLQNQKDDHPLNPSPNSQWNVYFKDNEILSQIFKDVRRLYPDISFFQQKIPKSLTRRSDCCNSSSSSTSEQEAANMLQTGRKDFTTDCDIIGRPSYTRAQSTDIIKNTFGGYTTKERIHNKNRSQDDEDDVVDTEIFSSLENDEYHWQVVARILFIYAKLNPGHGYVQGMNEIIGPIYYVFSNDCKNDLFTGHAESDTFWCFTELMSEIRDLYNSQLDSDRSTGVVAMMTKLTNLLSSEDPELYHKLLHVQSIKPHYYAFRWITLLLSQEFPLPGQFVFVCLCTCLPVSDKCLILLFVSHFIPKVEVLRIWDFLFSDQHRFDFLINVCCAMIMLLKRDLMDGDFASNMKLLQNFPERIDVASVTRKAKCLTNAFTTRG